MDNFYIQIEPANFVAAGWIVSISIILAVAFLAGAGLLGVHAYRKVHGAPRHYEASGSAAIWVAFFMAVIFTAFIVPASYHVAASDANVKSIDAQLDKHFDNVQGDYPDFTASLDGKYISGTLVDKGDGRYLVAIDPEVAK